jgi:hypothetical protein
LFELAEVCFMARSNNPAGNAAATRGLSSCAKRMQLSEGNHKHMNERNNKAAQAAVSLTRLKMDKPLATVLGRFKKEVGAVAGRSFSSDEDASMRGDNARLMPAWSNSELLQQGGDEVERFAQA